MTVRRQDTVRQADIQTPPKKIVLATWCCFRNEEVWRLMTETAWHINQHMTNKDCNHNHTTPAPENKNADIETAAAVLTSNERQSHGQATKFSNAKLPLTPANRIQRQQRRRVGQEHCFRDLKKALKSGLNVPALAWWSVADTRPESVAATCSLPSFWDNLLLT